MKINMSSNALMIIFLWIIVAILNIGMIIVLLSNKFFSSIFTLMFLIIFISAVFNIINLLKVYKDFLTLTEDSIVVNHGLIYKKSILDFSDIEKVIYKKSNMIFYMNNGIKKNISLLFINKCDEIKIYELLTSKSINVTT